MGAPLQDLLETLVLRCGVVGALVATTDGLVMASVAMEGSDADTVGAVASLVAQALRRAGERSGTLRVSGGGVCVALGEMLVVAALVEDGIDGREVAEALVPLVTRIEGWMEEGGG
jgi:predicted regulator of Ras-like GTPase activity (Roadblock/LC7/MglB family)